MGEEQLFVRLFGCNLSCSYCDTKLDNFTEYEPQELLDEIKLYENGFQAISFTGGEPLLQRDFLKETLKGTRRLGYRNYLETNGSLCADLEEVIDDTDIIAMDLKLSSSTGIPNLWDEHRRFLKVASRKEVFLKAVICQSTTEDELLEALRLIKETSLASPLVLQPNSYEDYKLLDKKLTDFEAICRKEKVTTFIIPQLHKLMGLR